MLDTILNPRLDRTLHWLHDRTGLNQDVLELGVFVVLVFGSIATGVALHLVANGNIVLEGLSVFAFLVGLSGSGYSYTRSCETNEE